MKTFLLLFVTSALIAIHLTTASPVQVVQAFSDGADKEIVATVPKVNELNIGRQQTVQQVAPVAVEEDDDDDDDDDDDLDLPLDDDDDDDDDEEGDDDDDDDDDYLERFFDDILGEDDDDDEEEDLSPSTGVVQAVPQPQQTAPVAATNVGDEQTLVEYPADDEVQSNGVEVENIQDGVDIVGADSALKDQTAEGQAVASVQPQASNQQVSNAAADDDDDDDDDDDEDVLEEALDDDDDDDDDEDDDDEDDDLIGEDVISARGLGRKGRKARATPALNSTEETEKSITPAQIGSTEILTSTPMAEAAAKNDEYAPTTISSIPVPDALVYRYNRYIDNIFERISGILKRSYDPVNVRLSTSITQKSGVKKQPGQKKKKKRNNELGRSNNEDVNEGKARTDCVETNQSNECSVASKSNTQKAVPVAATTSSTTKQKSGQPVVTKNTIVRRKVSSAAVKQKSPLKADTSKPQQQIINRARGTLHGLSTIKRHGNVRVTPTPEYLSVRSDFVLGPLVLKVEKSFGRGAKRETKRATATTTQMVGRINLRIVDDKATLHSIKVQQPKQVKVDSADNHDRTRKFVWQKSSHIAQVVSSKLASVAQDFLQQPPSSVEV